MPAALKGLWGKIRWSVRLLCVMIACLDLAIIADSAACMRNGRRSMIAGGGGTTRGARRCM